MTDAHLHLIVNHFPIIRTIIGLGILITGILIKNNIVKNTAYVIFIFSAILHLQVCLQEKVQKKWSKICHQWEKK